MNNELNKNKFYRIEKIKVRCMELFYGAVPKIDIKKYGLSKEKYIEIAEREEEEGLLEYIIVERDKI